MINRKKLGTLFFILILGLTFFVNSFLSESSEKEELPQVKALPAEKHDDMVSVSVWNKNFNVSDGVTEADVVTKEIPIEMAKNISNANGSDKFTLKSGAIAKKKLTSGEVVSQIDVSNPGDPDYYNLILKDGEVAFPIDISSQSMSTTSIHPKGYVDVYLMLTDTSKLSGKQQNIPRNLDGDVIDLLSKKLVLGVKTQDSGLISSIDIAVSKVELKKLIFSKKIGVLSVYGYSEGDAKDINVFDVAPQKRTVTEIRGD